MYQCPGIYRFSQESQELPPSKTTLEKKILMSSNSIMKCSWFMKRHRRCKTFDAVKISFIYTSEFTKCVVFLAFISIPFIQTIEEVYPEENPKELWPLFSKKRRPKLISPSIFFTLQTHFLLLRFSICKKNYGTALAYIVKPALSRPQLSVVFIYLDFPLAVVSITL